MTRDEALKKMQAVKAYMTSGNPIWSVTEIGEAFDMAIEALEQPERKTGKWVRITQGATPEKYMCPFCHSTVEHEGAEYLVSMMYPFCHCGARMVQEGEEP